MALAPLSIAENPPANSDFEAGVAAFGRGNLAQAQAYFEQARADGLNSPSLLYNLGVVYFRRGQHDSARAVFMHLLETPHAPLARYNLGLVMQDKGEVEAARQWFEQAAGPDSPEKVRALALRQLDMPRPAPAAARRRGYLSAGGGYDDNIAGIPDDASSQQAGFFADLLAGGDVAIGNEGFGVDGVAYTRSYPRFSEFDNRVLSVGGSWIERLGAGELTSRLSLAGSWFGGNALEREMRFEAGYRPDRCRVTAMVSGIQCRVQGSVSTIKGGSDFSAYDGERLRLGFSARKGAGDWLFRGRYRFELNHRKDLATGQQFFSVSPLRNRFSAEVRYQVSDRISLGARGVFRHSRYRNDHRLVSGGDTVSRRRTDHRWRGQLSAEYRLSRRSLLVAQGSLLDNRSNLQRYDYRRREALLGIEVGF